MERQCETWSPSCHSHFNHQGKSPQYSLIKGCVGPRAGMDALEKGTLNKLYYQFMLQGCKSLTKTYCKTSGSRSGTTEDSSL